MVGIFFLVFFGVLSLGFIELFLRLGDADEHYRQTENLHTESGFYLPVDEDDETPEAFMEEGHHGFYTDPD